MLEPGTAEIQTTSQEARVGRVEAVLGTLKHNANVHTDLVITTISAVAGGTLGGGLEGAVLGGFLGSFARKGYNAVDENGRRALAVAGEPVDRSVADSRHFGRVLVDAVRRRAVQTPEVSQMNPDSIRLDREVKYSTSTHR